MKKVILAFLLAVAGSPISAQTIIKPSLVNPDWGAIHSHLTAVDLDGDGYCDLVMAGLGNTNTNPAGTTNDERTRMSHVAMYDAASKEWNLVGFTGLPYPDAGIAFNVADRPCLIPCDINQDGNMDIIAFETSGKELKDEPTIDHISTEGIFLGYGDGTFSKSKVTLLNPDGTNSDFKLSWILTADVADFNNDGLLDIVGVGYHKSNATVKNYDDSNVVLLNQGGGCFVVSPYLNATYASDYGQKPEIYHLDMATVHAYDFNNDGYVDFFVNAESRDQTRLGVGKGTDTHFSELFLNDPLHPGQFRRQYINSGNCGATIANMTEGGIAIADFNNDGTPDLFYSGWTGNGRETYVWDVYTNKIAADGSVNFTANGTTGIEQMRNQSSTPSQYLAVDWDGDGNNDIINLGWSPNLSTQTAFLSTGDGTGKFENKYRLPGNSEGSVAVIDWDGDGSLDYITTGQSGDEELYDTSDFRRIFAMARNTNAPAAKPEAPTLADPTVNGSQVTLSWTEAASSKANVSYEYFVKDSKGRLVAGGNSIIGGALDGKRKVMRPGNAYQARKVSLTLSAGNYTYGVQTVDASFQGSVFALGSFVVSADEQPALDSYIERIEEVVESSEGKTYFNPVLTQNAPDPTLIRDDNGMFYLYATESNKSVPIYRSTDLVKWIRLGSAFTTAGRPNFVDGNVWAPDIKKVGDKYHLYFSMSKWGGEWEAGIGVAVADTPRGPFTDAHKLFISNEVNVQNSIDPFFIEEDGHKYIFWGSFRGIYAIELSEDGLSVLEGATPKHIAGTLTEGTFIVKRDGYYFLIGSAGTCCDGENSTYHLVVARSTRLLGPYYDKKGNSALNNGFSGLLYRSRDVIGPGHNGDIITDDEGQQWILYHGYEAGNEGVGRQVFLDKLNWDEDGWPYIEHMRPSNQSAAPVFYDKTAIDDITTDEPDKDHRVKIYPTYVKRTLQVTHDDGADFNWQVVSTAGEVVASGSATGSASIDFYTQPTGMYIVQVTSKTGRRNQKIIRY